MGLPGQVDGGDASEIGIGDGGARADAESVHGGSWQAVVTVGVSTVTHLARTCRDPIGVGPGALGHDRRATARQPRAGVRRCTPAIVRRVAILHTTPLSTASVAPPLVARWLGRIDYREAHDLQRALVEQRADGAIGDQLLLLEHPAVLTLGRHSDPVHIRATPTELAARGIEVVRVERGGEVTYHGPGQLVAYPIVALHRRDLLVRPFVRALEQALADTCASLGVTAGRREGHPGAWSDPDGPTPRKIGALGLRVERGVTFHGIALNIRPDLRDFDLIDPCGMPGVPSTSIARERREPEPPEVAPSTAEVEHAAWIFAVALATALEAALERTV